MRPRAGARYRGGACLGSCPSDRRRRFVGGAIWTASSNECSPCCCGSRSCDEQPSRLIRLAKAKPDARVLAGRNDIAISEFIWIGHAMQDHRELPRDGDFGLAEPVALLCGNPVISLCGIRRPCRDGGGGEIVWIDGTEFNCAEGLGDEARQACPWRIRLLDRAGCDTNDNLAGRLRGDPAGPGPTAERSRMQRPEIWVRSFRGWKATATPLSLALTL